MKKRITALTLIFTLLLLGAAGTSVASAVSVNELFFTLSEDGNTYAVTGCNNNARGELVIPDEYNGKPVTRICEGAFSGCGSITSAVIGNNVVSIEAWAFSETGIRSLDISDSVLVIGYAAFSGCSSLTSVTIPEQLMTISFDAFGSCDSLRTVYWNAVACDVLYCLGGAEPVFSSNSLTSIFFGNSVEVIPRCIVVGDQTLSHVQIGENVRIIYNNAFMDCKSLRSVVLPDSVIKIDGSAFALDGAGYDYKSGYLKELILGESVICVGIHAFGHYLEKLVLPASVAIIGQSLPTTGVTYLIHRGLRLKYRTPTAQKSRFRPALPANRSGLFIPANR